MNKLFTKIASVALGLTMAIGVAAAVGSSKVATKVDAAVSTRYTLNTASTTVATSTTYANYTETATKYNWTITLGTKQTNNPAGLWLGSNSGQKAKYILGNGGYSEATAIASAIGVTTSATYHAALFQKSGGTAIANVDTVVLTYGSTGNTAPSKAWIVYSTNNGTSWTVFDEVKTSLSSSGVTFSDDNVSSAIWGLVIYGSNYGTMRAPVLTFKGTDATTQTITVDPASKEAYTDETISLTTSATSASWALSNNTCGASLSAESGKTVTVSATGAGSVRVTASASGYTSPYVDLTFSERPTSPYITPEKSSTSGYTGQNETISFTYGNLTGSLNVSSSNTSVVTAESPSYDAGEGTVQFNFVGAGSTTVKFYDGSTERASINVSVTASSVSITGMPASRSLANGANLDLGALITVTPTGTCSSDVTWSTSDSTKVSISQAGVATGEAIGSAIITVTPDDYPGGAVSCTVTVANVITATFATGTTDGSGLSTDAAIKAVSGYSVDDNIEFTSITSCYGGAGYALKFGASSTKGSITVGLIDGKINSKKAYITKIVVNAITYGSDTTTLLIASTENTLTSSWADYDEEFDGTSTTTVTIEAKVASKNRFRISSIQIFYDFNAELDSVTTSGQTTSFTQDGSFTYGGTLTAHYTAGKADATVTPTAYKYGASGFNPASAGTAITIGTKLSVDTHNGKYISVGYTEGGITKWSALYQITVSYAAVTSVTLEQNSAEIGLNDTFDYTQVTVTVSPSTANPAVTWSVSENTVGDDYVFDGSGLSSKDTAGTITLRCESDADSSKYATIVVTVTGDPTAEFTAESVSGYVGKGTSVAFTYGNMDDTSKISVSSNDASVTVGAITASAGEGSVAITFVSAGSATLSVSYNGGSTLDSITVTVSVDSVTALTWSAPTIKVYSGATTTVSDASSWNVHYTMASGDYGSLVYGEYILKLGGSSITLPHTWDASEDGKVLSIEYGGFASPTTSTVNVTQTLQAVKAPVEGEPTTSTLTFTDKYSEGGATADDSKAWTVTSDGTESNFDSTKGIHYGTSSGAVQYIKLTSSDFTSGKITKVEVNASTASGVSATVSVTVSGEAFGGDPQSLSTSATNYTFTGNVDAGTIEVLITKPSSATKAIYCKSVAVTYAESSGTQNIANVAGHEAAQKAVVAFAKAMNAAFDDTANCTDGVAAAWSTASSAYSSNIANNASLSADEKAYANNLIKYATAQYTDDTDEDFSYCLERAMKTYEVCIQKHGQTGFMSDVRSVSPSSRITSLSFINGNGNTIAIIVIISMVSVTAIGGYFFLRKRKENQ